MNDLSFYLAAIQTAGLEGAGTAAHDPGGDTAWGIAKRFHPAEDIGALRDDLSRVFEIYRVEYWRPMKLERASFATTGRSTPLSRIAAKVFDMAINVGVTQATTLVQSALNANFAVRKVEEDGVMGPATIDALAFADPARLMPILCGTQAAFYLDLGKQDPARNRGFVAGWLARAMYVPA